jgi:hypothetical protein
MWICYCVIYTLLISISMYTYVLFSESLINLLKIGLIQIGYSLWIKIFIYLFIYHTKRKKNQLYPHWYQDLVHTFEVHVYICGPHLGREATKTFWISVSFCFSIVTWSTVTFSRRRRDRMVVGFTPTYAISAYPLRVRTTGSRLIFCMILCSSTSICVLFPLLPVCSSTSICVLFPLLSVSLNYPSVFSNAWLYVS